MLSDSEYLRLKAYAIERARSDLCTYMQLCDPAYKVGRMHRLIADELAKVESGEIKRLLIQTPPRYGKSEEVAIQWPTYMLGRHPEHKFIVATHTNSLAQDHSTSARDRLWNPLYKEIFPQTEIRQDFAGAKFWKTTAGGEYHTAGVTVKLSGFGANTLILDDMYAGYAEANSETIREAIWNWYQSTAKTRLLPGGSIVYIGTPWNVADLMARLTDPIAAERLQMQGAEKLTWRTIRLPESAEENDPLGRQPGETLCPEIWSNDEMRMLEAETETHIWSALYKCRPTLIGGNYLLMQNLEIISASDVPEDLRWMRAYDLAFGTKTANDYTAGPKGALTDDGMLIIADVIRGKWKWPDAQERIALQSKIENIPLGVEANGPQVAAADSLQEVVRQPVQKYYPATDIVARAGDFAVLLKNRKVKLVLGDWNSAFIAEGEAFPKGKHDDQISGVAILLMMLKSGPAAQAIAPIDRGFKRPERTGRILI